MKLISLILLIVLTGSVLIPCSDDVIDNSHQQEIVISENVINGGHVFDFCPPLCSCHCCHSHITSLDLLSQISEFQLSKGVSSYYSGHLAGFTFNIWEPLKKA